MVFFRLPSYPSPPAARRSVHRLPELVVFSFCILFFVLLVLSSISLSFLSSLFSCIFLFCCCPLLYMVVLSRLSFVVVVISSTNSKVFHAAIECLSSAATFGEGHATSQAVEVCSFVFLLWFGYCL